MVNLQVAKHCQSTGDPPINGRVGKGRHAPKNKTEFHKPRFLVYDTKKNGR